MTYVMKFAEFDGAYKAAKDIVRRFEGDRDWPGLSEYDRVFALPVDWQEEEYTAIVRAHAFHDHASAKIHVEVWHWNWHGGKAAPLDDLSFTQLTAVADIKRTVRRWIDGEIDELPPSTCRHLGGR